MVKKEDNKDEESKKPNVELREALKGTGVYLTLGVQLAVTMLVFFYLGKLADDHWEIDPFGKLIGTFLGLVSIVTQLFRIANQQNDNRRA